MSGTLGVYVHVPFCRTRCRYCDFYRVGENRERQRGFLQALDREIDATPALAASGPLAVDTVFFGGGTPSLLEPPQVAAILDRLRRRLPFRSDGDVEISLEANPSDLDGARLAGYREAGINRLSLGIQSFDDRELRLLGRRHDAERAARAVELAREAGFDNLSLDLMLAIPAQTAASWRRTLDRAIALAPDHLSLYLLEVHEGSEMDFLRRERPRLFPGEEAQRRRYLESAQRLAAAGFAQYEISNFARNGRRSRHNLKYWNCEPVLGLGPAAHSLLDGSRSRWLPDLAAYTAASPGREAVATDLRAERVFLGLRLAEGVPTAELMAASGVRAEEMSARLARLASFVESRGERVRLTLEGFVVSTPVIAALLAGPSGPSGPSGQPDPPRRQGPPGGAAP